MVKKINIFALYALISLFFTGCGQDLEALAESSAIIVFLMLFVYLGFMKIVPKLHEWSFPKKVFGFFITKVSWIVIVIIVLTGIAFLFAQKSFAFLISLTLFISAAYLYKLRNNYDEKSQLELEEDKKLWFGTLGTIFILLFLFFGGLGYVLT